MLYLLEIIKHLLKPKSLIKLISVIINEFKKVPFLYFLVIIMISMGFLTIYFLYPYYKYIHDNNHLRTTINSNSIHEKVGEYLNECGNGTTIARLAIGKEFIDEDKASISFDYVLSCVKWHANQNNCVTDGRFNNPDLYLGNPKKIDRKEVDILNQDRIILNDRQLLFKDNSIIELYMFNKDGSLTQEGHAVKFIIPNLYTKIIHRMKANIDKIYVGKEKDKRNNYIIYLYTLSFYDNELGKAEKLCAKDDDSRVKEMILNLIQTSRKLNR